MTGQVLLKDDEVLTFVRLTGPERIWCVRGEIAIRRIADPDVPVNNQGKWRADNGSSNRLLELACTILLRVPEPNTTNMLLCCVENHICLGVEVDQMYNNF